MATVQTVQAADDTGQRHIVLAERPEEVAAMGLNASFLNWAHDRPEDAQAEAALVAEAARQLASKK